LLKRTLAVGIILIFIGSSILPGFSGLNTEANKSDSHNTEYTGFEENRRRVEVGFIPAEGVSSKNDGTNGPLGEWPNFTPIGFITAPHPDYPEYQTYLYGDWGAIVGEEFLFLQDGMIKLQYHSYHETYMTQRMHDYNLLDNWTLGYDPVTKIKYAPLVSPGGSNPGPVWEHTQILLVTFNIRSPASICSTTLYGLERSIFIRNGRIYQGGRVQSKWRLVRRRPQSMFHSCRTTRTC